MCTIHSRLLTQMNEAVFRFRDSGSAQPDPVQAWHQGRLPHMTNRASGTDQEQEAWAVTIRATVAGQATQELSFLARLFGGLVLHVHNKPLPVV